MTRLPTNEDRLLTGTITCARFGETGSEHGAVSPSIVTKSAAMLTLIQQADATAQTDCTVLITGETGVGKDVLTRYIHFKSRRAAKELISINSGAFQESLFESEFFGCEKGAYTGAVARPGLLEAADHSTIFLDEIGDMPYPMQVKLLHFLEQGIFRRVGSVHDRVVNARVIAATNKDLTAAVANGTFREDLFYRLNIISLNVPPLRERREEIPSLAESFLTIFRSRFRRPHLQLSHDSRRYLQDYNWPGNIRELKNCIEKACALSDHNVIEIPQLVGDQQTSLHLIHSPSPLAQQSLSAPRPHQQIAHHHDSQDLTWATVEREHILNVLTRVGGNREDAAKQLGISTRTLYRKLREYETIECAQAAVA